MPIVKVAIYLLCFLASAGCAGLLARSYLQNGGRLLLWSSACFVLLALNNFLVVVDLLVLPNLDLLPLRRIASIGAVGVLLFGFVWEADES
jgi:hypothetical protein